MEEKLEVIYTAKNGNFSIKTEAGGIKGKVLLLTLTDIAVVSYLIDRGVLQDSIKNGIKSKKINISNTSLMTSDFLDLIEATESKIKIGKQRIKIENEDRAAVWQSYHGDSIRGICYTCGIDITPFTCRISHVIPHSKGGSSTFDNLRTCCSCCDTQMADQNLYAYLLEKELLGPGVKNVEAYFNKYPSQRHNTKSFCSHIAKRLDSSKNKINISRSNSKHLSAFSVLANGYIVENIFMNKRKNLIKLWNNRGIFVLKLDISPHHKIINLSSDRIVGLTLSSQLAIINIVTGEMVMKDIFKSYVVNINAVVGDNIILSNNKKIVLFNINSHKIKKINIKYKVKKCQQLSNGDLLIAFDNGVIQIYDIKSLVLKSSKLFTFPINCILQIGSTLIIGTPFDLNIWYLHTNISLPIAKDYYAQESGITIIEDTKIAFHYWNNKIVIWDTIGNNQVSISDRTYDNWKIVGSLDNKIVLQSDVGIEILDYITNKLTLIHKSRLDIKECVINEGKFYIITQKDVTII
jgi:hypothetical protein